MAGTTPYRRSGQNNALQVLKIGTPFLHVAAQSLEQIKNMCLVF
jgi:hypothetical protein